MSGLPRITHGSPFCFWALCLTSLAMGPSLAVDMGLCAQPQPFLTWPDPTQPDYLLHPHPEFPWPMLIPSTPSILLTALHLCLVVHITTLTWPTLALCLVSSFLQTASCHCSFASALNCTSVLIFMTPTPYFVFWHLLKKLASPRALGPNPVFYELPLKRKVVAAPLLVPFCITPVTVPLCGILRHVIKLSSNHDDYHVIKLSPNLLVFHFPGTPSKEEGTSGKIPWA